jgi:hypothetical protein
MLWRSCWLKMSFINLETCLWSPLGYLFWADKQQKANCEGWRPSQRMSVFSQRTILTDGWTVFKSKVLFACQTIVTEYKTIFLLSFSAKEKKKIFVFHLHKENIDTNALRWLVNFKKEHIIPNDSKNLWPIIW